MEDKYLLISIGCFECGEDTEIGKIVSREEIPEGFKIVQVGAWAGVDYSDNEIAVKLNG